MEEEARLKVEESLKEEERIKKEKEIEEEMKGGRSSKGTIKGMFTKVAKRKAEEASSGNTYKTKRKMKDVRSGGTLGLTEEKMFK